MLLSKRDVLKKINKSNACTEMSSLNEHLMLLAQFSILNIFYVNQN